MKCIPSDPFDLFVIFMVLAVFLVSSSTMVAISALGFAYVESFDSKTFNFGNFMAEYAHMKCIHNDPFCFWPQIFCSAVLLIALNPPSSFLVLGRLYKRAFLSFTVVSTIHTLFCSFLSKFFLLSWAGIPIPGLKSLSYAQLFVTYIALPYTQFQAITQVRSSSYSKNHNQCIYLAGLKGIFSSLAAS